MGTSIILDSFMNPNQGFMYKFMHFFAKTNSIDAYARSMVLVILCFLIGFGKFISLLQVISLKTPTMVTVGVFAFWMQMICIPFWLKRTKNLYLLSHYTIAMLYIGVLFSTYQGRGYTILNCTIFPILPLIATFLFSTFWDAFGWWLVFLLTNIAFYMYKSDWEPGDFPSYDQLRDFTFLGNLLCMSISAILGGVLNISSNFKQKELERERDKAQELSKMKSEFTANVSHEIRTPLVAVIGLSELLAKDSLLSTDQRYLINTIYSASLHLDNLVNNVLNFSKTEANMIELENTPFDVTDLVEETLLYFSAMAESCNIHLLSFIDPLSTDGYSHVSGDPHRIQQILQNLVANAIKFSTESSQGEVIITLDSITSKDDEHGRLFRFAVADNGIGMSKSGIQKLFLPFSQCDSSTTRRYGGTGLGLVICKQLCTLLGGDIEVDSEQGKGTTITFTIPLMLAKSPDKPPPEHPKKVKKMQTAAAADAAASAAAQAAESAETAEAEANLAAKAGLESQTQPTDEEVKAAKATADAAKETAKAARATTDAAQTTADAARAAAEAFANAEAENNAQPQPLPEPAPLPPKLGLNIKDLHSGKKVKQLQLDGELSEEETNNFSRTKKTTLDDLERLLDSKSKEAKELRKAPSTPYMTKHTVSIPSPSSSQPILPEAIKPTRSLRSISMGKLSTSPFSASLPAVSAADPPAPISLRSRAEHSSSATRQDARVSGGQFVKEKALLSPDFHKILTKSQEFWRQSSPLIPHGEVSHYKCTTGYLEPVIDSQLVWEHIRKAMDPKDQICVLAESPGAREVLKSMLLFRGLSNVDIMEEEVYIKLMHHPNPPNYRVVIAEAVLFSHIGVNGVTREERNKEEEGFSEVLDPAVFNPKISTQYILLVSCKYHRFGKFLEFPVPPIEGMTTKEHMVKVVFCAENPVRRTSLAQSLLACVVDMGKEGREGKEEKRMAGAKVIHKLGSPRVPAKSSLQILLCEDNLVNIEVLTRQLRRLGYTNLDVKNNGADGLKAFQEKEYDIILMDCQMPILDGYEATKEIRKLEKQRNSKRVPIVALTASALPEERERGLKSGMDNYLSKPIQLAVLQNVLEGVQA